MVGFLKRIRSRSECEVDPGWRPGRRKLGHGPVSVLYRTTTAEARENKQEKPSQYVCLDD